MKKTAVVAFVGRFSPYQTGEIPNEVHLAAAVAALGVSVIRIESNKHGWEWALPRDSCVILTTTDLAERSAGIRRHMSCRTAFWTLDYPDMFGRKQAFVRASNAVDFVLSSADHGLRGRLGWARVQGACLPLDVALSPTPRRPAAFFGSLYTDRRKILARVVERLGGEVRSPEKKSGLYNMDLARYLQETKVILGDNYTNSCIGYWSDRNYIVPGLGGFLLTAAVPGLEHEFSIGQHLAVWTDEKNIEHEIHRWIEDDQARETIRADGFKHVRNSHTWGARARQLLSALDVSTGATMSAVQSASGRKLNIGAGTDVRSGFVNCDLYPQRPGVEQADMLHLPYPDGSFEHIVANDVVEHVSWRNVPKALSEIARVLRAGGNAEVRVPDVDELLELRRTGVMDETEFVRRLFGDQGHPGDFHYAGFTKATLLRLLGAAGLEVESTHALNGNRIAICKKR